MKTIKSARVVVVGAGPAGIAAATRLLETGFQNVVVLEAENRIGGRIHTVPFGDNVIDLGAEWCHGEKDNVIFELVKPLNVLEKTGSLYDDYKCVRSNGEILADQLVEQLKTAALNTVSDRQTDLVDYEGSLGAYLADKYWSELRKMPGTIDSVVAKEFLENYKKFESSVEASDHLFDVSGKGHLEYWLCEGELLLNWKDKGFKSFLKLLMKSNPNIDDDWGMLNTRIMLNTSIENIQWQTNDGSVHIKFRNGEIIKADHVICTVSLGVLKEHYKQMFTPALPPAKCRAIEGIKLGTVNKFFMEFKEIFWPAEWSGVGFLWRDEDLQELRQTDKFWLESVFECYRVTYQPNVLCGWIIGAHARHMETLPEEEVINSLLWLFRKFFDFPVPEPLNFKRSQWYQNPNFRGSYSFRSMYTDELRTGAWDLATPLINVDRGTPLVQFAGEATHSHYFSTVHGAVESGWREAQRLLGYYLDRPQHM